MDSLYTLCVEWSKLAPDECQAKQHYFVFPDRRGGTFSIANFDEPEERMWIVDSVMHQLKERRIDYVLEGYAATSLLTDEPFYGYKALLPVGNHGWGMTAQPTPAHALLGAYLEYLKANRG